MASSDPQGTAEGDEAGEAMELHDLSEVEIPPTLEELDITANRLAADEPRIGSLPDCTSSPSGRTSSTTTTPSRHSPLGRHRGVAGDEKSWNRDKSTRAKAGKKSNQDDQPMCSVDCMR
ncbi:hypothetical protein ABZP36_022546 [Zizania latifolia]